VVVKFNSVDQAVRFAFRVRGRPEFAKSDPASVGPRGHGLSPMDLHGEASLILAKIMALPLAERSSVLAMYGDRGERAEAMVALGNHIMPLVASSLPNRQALQVMLMHWATRRPSVRTIAKDHAVSYRQVCKWRWAVADAWTPIFARAINRLDEVLFGEGGHELV
jgi:hypothetical protein